MPSSATTNGNRFLENVFSLGFLQATTYIIPLITFPYLVRVLGPEQFGKIAFATVTINYLILLTDYGFNLSATRQISINRCDQQKCNEIFSSVMIIKALLLIVSFLLLLILIFSFSQFYIERKLFGITFLLAIAQTVFPVWYFQGMERMRYIAYVSVCAKLFFMIAVFIFVTEESDYILVPLLTALGSIITGTWSLVLLGKKFKVQFCWQRTSTLLYYLKDGWHLFYSSLATSVYTTTIPFVLGLLDGMSSVGVFSAVDRIIQAAKGIYIPVSKALYPRVGAAIAQDRTDGIRLVTKMSKVIASLMFFISCSFMFFAEQIVALVLGSQYAESVVILRILAFVPFILAIGDVLSVQLMFNLGYQKQYSVIISVAAILGLTFAMLCISKFSLVGAAAAILIIEGSITVVLGVFIYRKFQAGFPRN